jgi:hypothetical protein
MAKLDSHLDRLLRAAAAAPDESPAEAPFGFATRVVALWRAGTGLSREANALPRLLRNVAIAAAAVSLVATVAVYQQINDDKELDEPLANDYAIADSAIQTDFLQ